MPTGGPGRTRRPASTPLIAMNCRVPASTRIRANAAADAMGITMGRYVELVIARDQVDPTGRPLWTDEIIPPVHLPLSGMEQLGAT